MYKLSETEVLAQPTEYVNESEYKVWNYKTGEGDGGFMDSFNALKYQIDFNYSQYKDQLRTLLVRQNKLKDDYRSSIRQIFFVALIPVFYYIILRGVIWLGLRIDLVAVLYTVLVLFQAPLVFVCDFLLMPGFVKHMLNYKRQLVILNSGPELEKYRRKHDIISFYDEKVFLKNTIEQYDKFYEDMIIEGWDKKSTTEAWKNVKEPDKKQLEILDRMRSLSIFHECKASVVETRKAIGFGWVIVGFSIILGVLIFWSTLHLSEAVELF